MPCGMIIPNVLLVAATADEDDDEDEDDETDESESDVDGAEEEMDVETQNDDGVNLKSLMEEDGNKQSQVQSHH